MYLEIEKFVCLDGTLGKTMKWRPLSYKLILGGESSSIELPFVLLVLTKLSGSESKRQPAIEDRRPIRLDADNFDAVLKDMAPRIHFTVANAFDTDESRINVSLESSSLDDFSPDSICEQVEHLKSITEIREQLESLLARIEGNRQFAEVLHKSLANKKMVKQLILSTDSGCNSQCRRLSQTCYLPAEAQLWTHGTGIAPAERAEPCRLFS